MSPKRISQVVAFGALLVVAVVAGCSREPAPQETADSYVAVVPSVLRAGATESIPVSLLRGDAPAVGTVNLTLRRDGRTVASAKQHVRAHAALALPIPRDAKGTYELEVKGAAFSDKASVQVQDGTILFVETDKPIYKPGQTVHVRVLTLDPDLKPLQAAATVEVKDAKGTKVFKQDIASDDYGMAEVELPLSTEPNLGVWKVTVTAGDQKTERDIRVEEYVLPKYEVKGSFPKEWTLPSQAIEGTVTGEYSFGKPVKGTLTVRALRYVGQWEEYATLTKEIDGSADFEIKAPGYVAGVPGARGMGNVQIEMTVREQSTGYEEKTTQLITVAPTPVSLQVIPEGRVFKPGLPFTFLVVTETPDNEPLDRQVKVTVQYMGKELEVTETKTYDVSTTGGKGLLEVTPPKDAVAATVEATTGESHASLAMEAAYSPSSTFIHVEQTSEAPLRVGRQARFRVHATKERTRFFYEVLSRGKVVFTGMSASPEIAFTVTPLMAPSARLLVYQIQPNAEVAADYLPFSAAGDYPHNVKVTFGSEQVRPGDAVTIDVQTQGVAKVGLVAVDRSVYILAENRLNLQEVFAELERLYGQPRVELHDARPFLQTVNTVGAKEVFADAGVVVMSNRKVPEGEKHENPRRFAFDMAWRGVDLQMMAEGAVPMATASPAPSAVQSNAGLAEVERVRQFFPETWLWDSLETKLVANGRGRATYETEAPDTITTWMLRAIGISKAHGLGIGEAELRVFQPFFLSVDLPYSAIRGEELPARIALYNYLDTAQEIVVDLEDADGFELLDDARKTVTVGSGEVGSATFTVRPTRLGKLSLKVTARSSEAADAVVKELIVEPEGVAREVVDNHVLSAGRSLTLDTTFPDRLVPGSSRAYIAITGSYLTQTIEGLEGLLRMPFGCGEQNMILFAPNVFVARYLEETGQSKPAVMAKAQNLMLTGYQRELTYQRNDGSFSAFGDRDDEGSLWLTAFVVKTFAQAQGFIFIDPAVLETASDWMIQHQRDDGSFRPVGFVHHQELLGGLQGNDALTAYVAVALHAAGKTAAAGKTVGYLEGRLDAIDDAYTMALTAYALELSDSPRAKDAYDKLMGMAKPGEDGLHWGDEPRPLPEPQLRDDGFMRMLPPQPDGQSAAIETTAYATLALLEHGDRLNASSAARWLVSRRNAFGGFGSTQDTVVGLEALTRFSTASLANVDLVVRLTAPDWSREVRITPANADVLQTIEVPGGVAVDVQITGKGEAVLQAVRRFNVPEVTAPEHQIFDITVDYGTDTVSVDDLITIAATIRFNPVAPVEAGMVVLDVAVPTGFAPVDESLKAMAEREAKVKRHDVAGRKVILYIENMQPGESLSFEFQARALYPVRAEAVVSQAYAYYSPDLRGESLGGAIRVTE